MADHARWGEAVGRALGWEPDKFRLAYDDNRVEATMSEIADSPVASALAQLAHADTDPTGAAARSIARELGSIAGDKIVGSARWPKSISELASELRHLAPQLRLHGLNITFDRRNGGPNDHVTPESTAIYHRMFGE